ncbi:MAG: ATP-dependent Clp protease adaptor ClpS [Myxococcota bacterium]
MSKKKGTDRKEDVKVLERFKKPRKFRVILHNDNYTPRGFVVQILEQVFRLPRATASGVMMLVHTTGKGVIASYSQEVAETKSNQANKIARDYGYPLTTTIEPE